MAGEKKNFKLIAAGAVVLLLLAGIGIGAQKGKLQLSSSDRADLIEVKAPTYKICASTNWVVADKKGFFEKEGIKIVYTGELISTQILPSVLNGNNDVATAQPNLLAIAKSGGAKVTAVARNQVEPGPDVDPIFRHMRWYVKPETGVKSIADLKNYKAGEKLKTNGTVNSCNQFLFNTLLDKYGVARDRFEWVTFTNDIAVIQSTSQGILDVAQVHPPYYKSAEDAGLILIDDSTDTDLGEAAGASLYYFRDDYIKEHPDTVKRFVRAVIAAQKWSNENPDESIKLTADWINVPVTGVHYFATTSEIKESDITPWLKDLENSGALQPGQIKASDLITHEFDKEAI
jgi:ABC-type nitrate/sulfonate/bicarbonate transport system substrate-binding protein